MAKNELRVSEMELTTIKDIRAEMGQIENLMRAKQETFARSLALIGDRYDVDLVGGAHIVASDGRILSKEEAEAQMRAAQQQAPQPELLTEDED